MPKRANYDKCSMELAIQDYKTNGGSVRASAKKYGVPKSSLQFKINNPDHKDTCGPSPVLPLEEEKTLAEWIKALARKGFARKKEDVISSVQEFLIMNPRENPFTNNRPGEGWYKAFLKRHPDIVERSSEGVSSASSCVSESDIRKWFSELLSYIEENSLQEVIKDPSRMYNGDETAFQTCPETGRVLAPKGEKNVYSIEESSSKENLTVMYTFSADGRHCPPLIVYPYKRIPEKISTSVPADWGIARSDTGWMTAKVFFEYIANVFHPYLVSQNIKFPVILFVDGHRSHLTYQTSVLCRELQIELFALYPNATRILQPGDVSVFRPIKVCWRKAVRNWYANNPGKVLNKISFAPLLKEVVETAVKPETLINGFKACGLFPLNPDAVDYTKCLGNSFKEKAVSKNQKDTNVMTYNDFINVIGEERIETFKKKSSDETVTADSDAGALFLLWKYFTNEECRVQSNPYDEESGAPNDLFASNVESDIAPSISGISNATQDSAMVITEFQEEVIDAQSILINTDGEQNNIQNTVNNEVPGLPNATPASSNFSRTATVTVSGNSVLGEFLVWPETPKRKNKRQTERFPFAITSRKYQEMFETKRQQKVADEMSKAEKKRKREEVKNLKSGGGKNTLKKKLFSDEAVNKTDNNVESIKCYVCKKNIGCTQIKCHECKNCYHIGCIPENHQQHVPNRSDEDHFYCHNCYREDNSDTSVNEIQDDDDDDDEEFIHNLYVLAGGKKK